MITDSALRKAMGADRAFISAINLAESETHDSRFWEPSEDGSEYFDLPAYRQWLRDLLLQAEGIMARPAAGADQVVRMLATPDTPTVLNASTALYEARKLAGVLDA